MVGMWANTTAGDLPRADRTWGGADRGGTEGRLQPCLARHVVAGCADRATSLGHGLVLQMFFLHMSCLVRHAKTFLFHLINGCL